MAAETERARPAIDWSDDMLELRIEVDQAGLARITRLRAPSAVAGGPGRGAPGAEPVELALPLLDVVLAPQGKAGAGGRYCESHAGPRFRFVGHGRASDARWRELRVD